MLHPEACRRAPLRRAFTGAAHAATLALAFAGGLTATAAQAQTRPVLGIFAEHSASFWTDLDGDGQADVARIFGRPGDIGLLADLDGTGNRCLVTFRSGTWSFDCNGDGVVDRTVSFGQAGDIPLVGDLDGDGKDDLIIYRQGTWLVSTKADGIANLQYRFGGQPGDVPVLGDPRKTGAKELIVFNGGRWSVANGRQNQIAATYAHGQTDDAPIVVDFDGDGADDLVVMRGNNWYAKSLATGAVSTYAINVRSWSDQPLVFGRRAASVTPPPTTTPPPPTTPPATTPPGPATRLDAARFLQSATFGTTDAEIAKVQQKGYDGWLADQFGLAPSKYPVMAWWPQSRPRPPTTTPATVWPVCSYAMYTSATPYDPANPCDCVTGTGTDACPRDVYTNFQQQRLFFQKATTAPDQLRHRVAWALSQILVTSSAQDPIAYPMRNYYQLLVDNAFGNFESLLNAVTLDPWMGNYLDMVNNARASGGRVPNENYARELLQLFSIGLWELKSDGALLLDAQGDPIPTYDQTDITELARALTGWTYPALPGKAQTWNSPVNYVGPMQPIEGALTGTGTTNYHDVNAKTVMGSMQPAATRALDDVSFAIKLVANHPNTGPFIGRQLIQQLVTSNPSPAYVKRVVDVWNNNGSGVRGDLKAVVRAVLLDPEARAARNPVDSTYGKLKEPALAITSFLRAMNATTDGLWGRSAANAMGQNVFTSPTVFNYYSADYVIPGTKLTGPPFNIFDATLYFARTNQLYNLIYSGTCDTGAATSPSVCGPAPDTTVANATGTKIDYSGLKALAVDPAALVAAVDDRLMSGGMPASMKTSVIQAVGAVALSVPPTQAQLLDRVRMAVYLTAVSPHFQVEY